MVCRYFFPPANVHCCVVMVQAICILLVNIVRHPYGNVKFGNLLYFFKVYCFVWKRINVFCCISESKVKLALARNGQQHIVVGSIIAVVICCAILQMLTLTGYCSEKAIIIHSMVQKNKFQSFMHMQFKLQNNEFSLQVVGLKQRCTTQSHSIPFFVNLESNTLYSLCRKISVILDLIVL